MGQASLVFNLNYASTGPVSISEKQSIEHLLRRQSGVSRTSSRKIRERERETGSVVLPTLATKREIDTIIRDTLDKVLVIRFGRASDPSCLHLDDILSRVCRDVSRFVTIGLVDVDTEEVKVYVEYFDITLVPATVFFFNAHHMKIDSGTADHTKWIGSFHSKQDFIDVVETASSVLEQKVGQDFLSSFREMERSWPKKIDEVDASLSLVSVPVKFSFCEPRGYLISFKCYLIHLSSGPCLQPRWNLI